MLTAHEHILNVTRRASSGPSMHNPDVFDVDQLQVHHSSAFSLSAAWRCGLNARRPLRKLFNAVNSTLARFWTSFAHQRHLRTI